MRATIKSREGLFSKKSCIRKKKLDRLDFSYYYYYASE